MTKSHFLLNKWHKEPNVEMVVKRSIKLFGLENLLLFLLTKKQQLLFVGTILNLSALFVHSYTYRTSKPLKLQERQIN